MRGIQTFVRPISALHIDTLRGRASIEQAASSLVWLRLEGKSCFAGRKEEMHATSGKERLERPIECRKTTSHARIHAIGIVIIYGKQESRV